MNEIDQALDNLQAIKSGEDNSVAQPSTETTPTTPSDDALTIALNEVQRLYNEHDLELDRDKLHVAVTSWERKNGLCKYHAIPKAARNGKRMTTNSKTGHHTIAINPRIIEDSGKNEFIDTVRHELAHAECFVKYGGSQKHNHHWKAMAAKLGADPSACHKKKETDHNYYIGCPNCPMKAGKLRRSKTIKQPFNRRCTNCGETELVSWGAGDDRPTENGVVAVESIPWDNREEWIEAGRP